jgi:hypothetical protein
VVIDTEGHALARYFQQRGITVAVLKYPNAAAGGHGEWPAVESAGCLGGRPSSCTATPRNGGSMKTISVSLVVQRAGIWRIMPQFWEVQPRVRARFCGVALSGSAHGWSVRSRRLASQSPRSDSNCRTTRPISLEKQVRNDLPPFFIVHAWNDKVVPAENSIDLAAALRRVKVPVELLIVEKDGHGFGLGRVPEPARWKQSFLT